MTHHAEQCPLCQREQDELDEREANDGGETLLDQILNAADEDEGRCEECGALGLHRCRGERP